MNWTLDNLDLIAELTLHHIRLSVIPIALSFVIAVPLGWLANQHRALRAITISAGSLLYTIPSLPLFVILPYVLGTRVLSEVNLLVALTLYGVAVLVRSAADALASVDDTTRQAATAVGYSTWSRFWAVELPLAGPALLAGMRVVSVSTIALVSVGAIIGSRNLGYLFLDGRARNNLGEILVGIVASVLIALILDRILVLLGRFTMPWSEASKPQKLALRRRKLALRRRKFAKRSAQQEGPSWTSS